MANETDVPELWTPAQTAEYLHTTESALRVRRYRRSGPPWVKAGVRVFYRADEVVAWLRRGGEAA
ncbi:MAG TPA: DNA-binding protein [Candidatus Dietzia intestinigallinarum]|nr:DNA-binding protein [Candidatus Dietzia intestinipullorum]HJC58946.1 DNA-binding protein [Candidatus Dietzia intestinigallinarum]